jgi:hypothetical protein
MIGQRKERRMIKKDAFQNLKCRRVYQFYLDEETGEITDITSRDDFVQVVRCKDCKWYYGDYCGGFGDGAFTPEHGFCHNAERKEQ